MQRERGTARDHRGSHHPIPPEQRRRWLIGTVVGLLVAVTAITGGPWVYARVVDDPAPEPLELSTPAAEAPVDPAAPIDPDGTWTVDDGSQAGYRIGEVLTGDRIEVVGRTDEVTGTATVDAGQLTAAEIVVQTGAITTDQSARDAYFRRALDTTTHPQATFTLDQPVDVSAVGDGTGPLVVQAPGTLVIGSSSVQVLADLQIQRNAGRLEVAGSIPLVLSDLGLTAPDLGFVTVDPDGSVEVLLLLVR